MAMEELSCAYTVPQWTSWTEGLIDWSVGVAVGRGTIVITMTKARIIDGRKHSSILLDKWKILSDKRRREIVIEWNTQQQTQMIICNC